MRRSAQVLCADLDGNGLVDIDDVVCVLLEAGGTPCSGATSGDIASCGGSGLVDIDDTVNVLLTAGDINNPPCPHPCQ